MKLAVSRFYLCTIKWILPIIQYIQNLQKLSILIRMCDEVAMIPSFSVFLVTVNIVEKMHSQQILRQETDPLMSLDSSTTVFIIKLNSIKWSTVFCCFFFLNFPQKIPWPFSLAYTALPISTLEKVESKNNMLIECTGILSLIVCGSIIKKRKEIWFPRSSSLEL